MEDVIEKENKKVDSRPYTERARIDARKRVKTNPEYVKADIRMRGPTNDKKRHFYCCSCGKDYTAQRGNFYSSGRSPLWKGNNGFVPICKSCAEAFFQSMISFYSGNEEHALKHMCALFDWYYDEDASIMTMAQAHHGYSRVSMYPTKMGTAQVARRGSTYLDTVRNDEKRMELTSNLIIKEEIKEKEEGKEEEEFEVTKEMVRIWGSGFTNAQYQFLEQEYEDWIAKNVCNTKSQEELFRNIALAQLDIRIARQNGSRVSDAQDALQKLMNSANILPKQTSDNVLADTQTFGTLLKKYEETRPLPEPDPAWKDVDGIKKYIDTWFYGHLSKAVGMKNENAAKYEEEVGKYTVNRPSDEDLKQESDLIDLFDSGGKSSDDEREVSE